MTKDWQKVMMEITMTTMLKDNPTVAISAATTKLNKLINDHLSNLPKNGDIVKAQILKSGRKEILVDIPGFTTGVIRGREVKNLPLEYQHLEPGTTIEAMVTDTENENGQMELSLQAALVETAWRFVKEKEERQEVIDIKINGANKGGLLASIKGMTAFLPVSQLIPEHYPHVEGGDKKRILKKLKDFVGKVLTVKIISSNPEEEKIIISEKKAWEETQKLKILNFKVGQIITVNIKSITHFGAFVKFDDNLEGLVHVSQIPRAGDPDKLAEPLEIRQELPARIIDIKGSRVFFSLKNLTEPIDQITPTEETAPEIAEE
ncbi:MAG: hypothetical protein A2445_01205 [Candidatus Jacksonbacteria bacterium RIFOXYC2_FULL_44_29]|nr:MAG: hypothetical protein A2240_05235 [Candidatus Jacksonbacteria bacterium RIFOXYA2_FULL_43_12]OGY76507.1 MAG: hypothetical protein A2295_02020 [Candidatus Jacksonbacteria bacterium RIFOXYB2_FULL_44_15]OGY78487.1 MAG: hypothetical protein A2445_01205 [Candidatus Jacksonbacteria bacterium RIFOXYC2_FULL_44_29]OGY81144.1 MAG: hypothetical protein A2550_01600 [Candidatus Jacksonbacteria bacterium RIFOXYD2_FULL_43_21]